MDLRKERTLKYLTQSLTDLMREKPLDQISVSEICEHIPYIGVLLKKNQDIDYVKAYRHVY